MDPMICFLFEVVLEVRVTTRDQVYKELVTLATFQYMPKITLSRLYPVELGDDYILETKPAEFPQESVHHTANFSYVMPLSNAQIVLEGIVSEKENILKIVEIRE